ncbi:phosphatidate cytidylyltransferase [soil metagenome]
MFNSALQQRIITALILIPLTILAIYKLPSWGFAILTGIIVVMAAWEWTKLCGISTPVMRFSYLTMIVLVLVASYFTFFNFQILYNVFCLAALWWIMAACWIYKYQTQQKQLIRQKGFYPFLGIIVLLPCWLALNSLRLEEHGPSLVLLLLVLVWTVDIGAFFVGKRWGQRRLAVNVSPGKTLEGLYGGLICVSAVAIIAGLLLNFSPQKYLFLLLIVVVSAIFSVVGDLFISVLKRQQGLKDTGALLPGHGGLLDRIDSLLAAAPIFVLGLHTFVI